MEIRLTLEQLADGIAATMKENDKVRIIGDNHSGGLSIVHRIPSILPHNRNVTEEEHDICYGVLRPELDEFAEMIRKSHRKRFANARRS